MLLILTYIYFSFYWHQVGCDATTARWWQQCACKQFTEHDETITRRKKNKAVKHVCHCEIICYCINRRNMQSQRQPQLSWRRPGANSYHKSTTTMHSHLSRGGRGDFQRVGKYLLVNKLFLKFPPFVMMGFYLKYFFSWFLWQNNIPFKSCRSPICVENVFQVFTQHAFSFLL